MMANEKGDIFTLEVDVLTAWADGTVTFSLFGHTDLTMIQGGSPQILGIEKAAKHKSDRRRTDA